VVSTDWGTWPLSPVARPAGHHALLAGQRGSQPVVTAPSALGLDLGIGEMSPDGGPGDAEPVGQSCRRVTMLLADRQLRESCAAAAASAWY
jgi:hypothetical protein